MIKIDNKKYRIVCVDGYYFLEKRFLFWWFSYRFWHYYRSGAYHTQYFERDQIEFNSQKELVSIVAEYKTHVYKKYHVVPVICASYNNWKLTYVILETSRPNQRSHVHGWYCVDLYHTLQEAYKRIDDVIEQRKPKNKIIIS